MESVLYDLLLLILHDLLLNGKKIVNWAQILPFYHLQATGYFSVNPIYSLLVIIYLLFTRKVFSNFI